MTRFGKVLRAGVAAASLVSGAGAARASDGFFSFFQEAFGANPSARAPAPGYGDPGYDYDAPPLTVRRHPRRHASYGPPARTPQEVLADSKGVTIYTDKTLEPGDVVMTPHGLRVFDGASSVPHTDEDFVMLSDAPRMSSDKRKQLHSIDVAAQVATGY